MPRTAIDIPVTIGTALVPGCQPRILPFATNSLSLPCKSIQELAALAHPLAPLTSPAASGSARLDPRLPRLRMRRQCCSNTR